MENVQGYFSQPCESSVGQDSTADADSLFGKTSPEPSAVIPGETLRSWLDRWLVANPSTFPQKGGGLKARQLARKEWSNGQSWTRSGSEWRSGAAACSLSQILETGPVGRQYFLSPKACAGILRRAEKRGKVLPTQLLLALQAVAGVSSGVETPEDKTLLLPCQSPCVDAKAEELLSLADLFPEPCEPAAAAVTSSTCLLECSDLF